MMSYSRLTTLLVSACSFGLMVAAHAELGASWETLHPTTPTADYHDIASSASRVVAVGNRVISSSADGVNWVSQSTGADQIFNVASSGQSFLALALDNNAMWTSTDGVAWQRHLITALTRPWNKPLWVGNRWVAIGQGDGIHLIVSYGDGTQWQKLGTSISGQALRLVWSGSRYVLEGYDGDDNPGYLVSTADGVNWTTSRPGAAGRFVQDLCSNGTVTVAAIGNQLFYSSTGEVWSEADAYSGGADSIVWTGTQFIGLVPGSDLVQTSVDGSHWTTVAAPAVYLEDSNLYPAFCWTGSQMVAAGTGGRIYTSPDALTWTQRAPVGANVSLTSIAKNNSSRYVAVGGQGAVAWSDDRVAWHEVVIDANPLLSSVAWDGTGFVAVGDGLAMKSTDGVTWSDAGSDSLTSFTLNNVAAEGPPFISTLIATGYDRFDGTTPIMVRSTDGGTTWLPVALPTGISDLKAITYLKTPTPVWLAGATDGVVLRSADGVNWSKIGTMATTWPASAFAFNGSLYVAVSRGGFVFTSTNLSKWTQRKLPDVWKFSGVAWTGSEFVIAGDYGGSWGVLTSADGITWKSVFEEPGWSPSEMLWDGSALVAVGDRGEIRTSYGVPLAAFAKADQTVIEGVGTAQVQVTLSYAPPATVTVPITLGGTATSGSDYTAPAANVVFNAGETSKTILVPITPDTDVETDETITLTLGAASGVHLNSNSVHTITIQDDEGPPTVTLSPSAKTVGESVGTVSITVALSWPSASTVTVPLTLGGTATDGADFSGVPASLTFAPGETTKTIFLAITNDTDAESEETVVISLGSLTNATPGAVTSTTVTILDNDGPARDWTVRSPANPVEQPITSILESVVWTGTQFIATGQGDLTTKHTPFSVTSPDGQVWQQHTVTGTSAVKSLAWSGQLLVGATGEKTISTSSNGLAWTRRATGLTATHQHIEGVCWAGNQFVAVGGSNTTMESIVLTSPNGTAWTRHVVPSITMLRTVTSNGSLIVAAGDEGEIITSPDGVNWTRRASGQGAVVLRAVACYGSQFVVVGDPGYDTSVFGSEPKLVGPFRISTSPDGLTWTAVPSGQLPVPSDTRLRGVCWNGDQWVAVGGSGTILTSSDAQQWRYADAHVGLGLRAVTSNGAVTVIVGDNGFAETTGTGSPPSSPTVEFASATISVSESAGYADIVIKLSSPATTLMSVPVVVNGLSTAAVTGADADVVMPASPLVIRPGEMTKILRVVLKSDYHPEGSEHLVIDLPAGPPGAVTQHTLTINDNDIAPAIPAIGTPQHQLVPLGSPLVMNVAPTGDQPLSYQWKKNGKAIAGAKSPTFYTPKAALSDAGTYTVIVTNAAGTASATVEVGVFEDVVRNIANPASKGAVLTQLAAGNGLTFAWYKDGGATAVATGTPLTFKTLGLSDPGQYRCQVLQTMSSQLWNANTYNVALVTAPPTLDALTLPPGQVGIAYVQTVPPGTGSGDIASWSAKNLPAGLVLNTQTGSITGYPTTAGSKTVTITATNGLGHASVTAPLLVTAIHPLLAGTSSGLMERNAAVNANLGARVQLDLTTQGTFTGSYTVGTAKHSFSGQAIADSLTTAHGSTKFDVDGKNAELTFAFDLNAVGAPTTGSLAVTAPGSSHTDTATFTAFRLNANPAAFSGRYNFTLELQAPAVGDLAYPQGTGFGSAVISSTGVVTFSGRVADTKAYTCSSFINTVSAALLYASPYKQGGTLMSSPKITLDPVPAPDDLSTITDAATTWSRSPDSSKTGVRNYPAGWSPVTLKLDGSRYAAAQPGLTPLDDNYVAGSSQSFVRFTGPSLVATTTVELAPSGKIITRPFYGHRMKLTVVPSTGLFSGSNSIFDIMPNGILLTRSFSYYGLIVRRQEPLYGNWLKNGYGMLLLPQIPAAGISPMPAPTSTPILGCGVKLDPN